MKDHYRAYLLQGPKKIELGTLPMPVVRDGEALVRLHSANICPTDLKKFYNLDEKSASALASDGAVVLGHEGAGVVESVGKLVTNVKVGDRVAIDPMLPCGKCAFCQTGDYPLCLNLRGVGVSAGSVKDSQELLKEGIGGMFAEYVKVPAGNLFILPERMDFSSGAMMEPLSDVLHSIEAGAPQPSDVVVVIGLGAMGLMHVQVLSTMGIQKVIGIDPIAERRAKAATFGAYLTLDPSEIDIVVELKKITDNLGVDLIFVCAGGSVQTKVTQQALQAVRKKGRIMLYASALKPAEIPVDINHIHYSMVHLSGTVGFYPRHGYAALELLQQGKISVDAIRTPRIPFNQFVDAFTISLESGVTKVGIELFDA